MRLIDPAPSHIGPAKHASYRATAKGSRADAVAGQTDAPGVTFVVDLREWKYDYGGFRPSFNYDITVRIYDEKDRLLSSEDFSGTDRMPTARGWKSFKYRYAELYQTIFDRVFENPAIRTGLRGEASASAGPGRQHRGAPDPLRKLLADGLIDQATFDREQQRVLSEI